ncbi:MAG: hypothetical protein Q9166_002956 [cf. Caloplaca sp. 2 TL-2023]
MEQLQAKHRQEQRELQARITQKKKSATKKTRRGVNDDCAELERQLKERQDLEIVKINGQAESDDDLGIPYTNPDPVQENSDGNIGENRSQIMPISSAQPNTEQTRKPNRQKARLARRAAEQEFMVAQAANEAQQLPDLRQQEIDAMRSHFTPRGLKEHEVRSDGHCLYAAVADQLAALKHGLTPKTPLDSVGGVMDPSNPPYKVARLVTASYIRDHADDFLPFLEEPLDQYVSKIRDTGEWGGHLELLALAKAYDVDINVLQSSGQTEKIESGTPGMKSTLWLSYYHHNFGLGEHYNSLRQAG